MARKVKAATVTDCPFCAGRMTAASGYIEHVAEAPACILGETVWKATPGTVAAWNTRALSV